MDLNLNRVHNRLISDVFDVNGHLFVAGVSGKEYLESVTLYRVEPDGSLKAAFWRETEMMKWTGADRDQYLLNCLKYFTDSVQRYYDEEGEEPVPAPPEEQELYDYLADQMKNVKYNFNTREFYLVEE